jgi:hypothetical protein
MGQGDVEDHEAALSQFDIAIGAPDRSSSATKHIHLRYRATWCGTSGKKTINCAAKVFASPLGMMLKN